jgi:S1-C subfamily serine protease
MLKPCLTAILAVALLACSPPTGSGAARYDGMRATVHIIHVDNGSGSGVMIEDHLMLTAAHVVKGATTVKAGPKGLPAKVLRVDEEADIALLQVPLKCPCAPVAKTAPAVDTDVVVIGYPLSHIVKRQIATEGQTQGIDGNRLYLNVSVAGGNSGGGVFTQRKDGSYELVGILVEMVGTCYSAFSCGPVAHLSRAVETLLMRKFIAS